ncbi:TIGR03985 family CRISPR-associated protein [Leptothoe spongobia]|uniref:TIGR03985 family CRISPR-associated protein n=1 Tax=Leptothoe spongobia TAU-MAC 1115 TaxID=1967444 RepID=A0A947DIR5_9CYAN|nr:TIGR03985 family CRISPR-associated protein [Leptothoe spongobia]MBT9317702.1 TIGR03985 family CRISPR-associated protein [Leptothoe spongobia TAU-MAC 1115]
MPEEFWSDLPEIPLLQWLARGSLKQHLTQALRMWIWLRYFYGAVSLPISEPFSYADCREALFTADHPSNDDKPGEHNEQCPCAKTVAAWLFAPDLHYMQAQWEDYAADYAHEVEQKRQQFIAALTHHDVLPKQWDRFLDEVRLFGVTRRALSGDLKRLQELKLLASVGNGYGRVTDWPVLPYGTKRSASVDELAFLVQPDLAAIADSLSHTLEGQRRFFVHVDYVVPKDRHDRVEDWQTELRELWQRSVVLPIRLTYWHASRQETATVVVYPVCLYYYRRGPYLCGFGEVFGQSDTVDWRNYRLDRIQAIEVLSWDSSLLPLSLRQQYLEGDLPTPDDIQVWMAEAWGFDYYQPKDILLVRFDQVWDQRYIRNSLRHPTFQRIDYGQAQRLIGQTLRGELQGQMLDLLAARSDQDAYYRAVYRRNDPNVKQRLRAWRPHIEVLLPWPLRQQFGREVMAESGFYRDIV